MDSLKLFLLTINPIIYGFSVMRALPSQFMGYKDIQNKINPATGPILGGQNRGPIPGMQCTDFLPIPLISKF